jgi:DNA polymerase/3'-5' exonuclease PolX
LLRRLALAELLAMTKTGLFANLSKIAFKNKGDQIYEGGDIPWHP